MPGCRGETRDLGGGSWSRISAAGRRPSSQVARRWAPISVWLGEYLVAVVLSSGLHGTSATGERVGDLLDDCPGPSGADAASPPPQVTSQEGPPLRVAGLSAGCGA